MYLELCLIKNAICELTAFPNSAPKSAEANSSRLLKNEKIIKYINELLDDLADNCEINDKEIIREFIERIEIHSDKQVDIYFNFKPLQDLNEDLNSFCVAKKEYERKVG